MNEEVSVGHLDLIFSKHSNPLYGCNYQIQKTPILCVFVILGSTNAPTKSEPLPPIT
jgi:hypothetical protein